MGLFSKDSKFSAQLFEQACTLFGVDAENTTEAELHQAMIDAGTIQAEAETKAKEGAEAVVADLKAQIKALEAEKVEAEQSITEAENKTTEVEGKVTTLTEELTTANSAIALKVKECNTLAAEVARLTAKKLPGNANATDNDNQFEAAPAGKGIVVQSKLLEEAMN